MPLTRLAAREKAQQEAESRNSVSATPINVSAPSSTPSSDPSIVDSELSELSESEDHLDMAHEEDVTQVFHPPQDGPSSSASNAFPNMAGITPEMYTILTTMMQNQTQMVQNLPQRDEGASVKVSDPFKYTAADRSKLDPWLF